MCWSLVVCSHVFSVVDATRHTKTSWVKIIIIVIITIIIMIIIKGLNLQFAEIWALDG